MISSIYENGGFWIGRYEVGIEENFRNYGNEEYQNHPIENQPVIKKDVYPYTWVTCSQAQEISTRFSINNMKTSLLFGLQWDLICKYLEKKSDLTFDDIKSDSKNWGNYTNSQLLLLSGKYLPSEELFNNVWKDFDVDTENYVINSLTDINEDYYQVITTGSSKNTKVLNIYDLAGNIQEWTLEYGGSSKNGIARGGFCMSRGVGRPVSDRTTYISSYNSYLTGFRVAMY